MNFTELYSWPTPRAPISNCACFKVQRHFDNPTFSVSPGICPRDSGGWPDLNYADLKARFFFSADKAESSLLPHHQRIKKSMFLALPHKYAPKPPEQKRVSAPAVAFSTMLDGHMCI